jgi:hypothetical protein
MIHNVETRNRTMIHLNLQFPSLAHLNRFFANPLDYSPEGVVPVPINGTVEAPTVEVQKRGPGRPKKVVEQNMSAQPEVANNTGSPSPSQPAIESPPSGSDGAVIAETPSVVAAPVAPSDVSATPVTKTIDLDAVRASLAEYSQKHGMEKARELLKKFGVARISEVPQGQYEALVKAASA